MNFGKNIFFCSSKKECWSASYLGIQICEFLKRNGYHLTGNPEEAEFLVINTCTILLSDRHHSIEVIRHFQKASPNKKIIVVGCLTDTDTTTNFLKDLVLINPKELFRLNEIFPHKIPIENVTANRLDKGLFSEQRGTERYFIRVSEGCIFQCTYCAIRLAKGSVRSKPIRQVKTEFEAGLEAGHRNFMLLADDCYSYGADLKTDFVALMKTLTGIPGDYRIGVYYLHPYGLLRSLRGLKPVITSGKINFIQVPIISGSKKMLKSMNRSYDPAAVYNAVRWMNDTCR